MRPLRWWRDEAERQGLTLGDDDLAAIAESVEATVEELSRQRSRLPAGLASPYRFVCEPQEEGS